MSGPLTQKVKVAGSLHYHNAVRRSLAGSLFNVYVFITIGLLLSPPFLNIHRSSSPHKPQRSPSIIPSRDGSWSRSQLLPLLERENVPLLALRLAYQRQKKDSRYDSQYPPPRIHCFPISNTTLRLFASDLISIRLLLKSKSWRWARWRVTENPRSTIGCGRNLPW